MEKENVGTSRRAGWASVQTRASTLANPAGSPDINDLNAVGRRILWGLGLSEKTLGQAEKTATGATYREESLYSRAERLFRHLLASGGHKDLALRYTNGEDDAKRNLDATPLGFFVYRKDSNCIIRFRYDPSKGFKGNGLYLTPPFSAIKLYDDGTWLVIQELQAFIASFQLGGESYAENLDG